MTNDITTLNGALRELGETMAANLTTQGVASTYDEGLTTLAGKILDIQGGGGGTVSSVSLTGSSAILSYADSDSLTLTATVLDSNNTGVSGETVEFFNGATSMGTAVTNSSGIATMTYNSTGAGDVSFTAECSSISSETYAIVDGLYAHLTEETLTSTYTSGDHSSVLINDLSLNLPTNFELTFKLKSSINGLRFGLVPVQNKAQALPTYSILAQQGGNTGAGVYRDSSTHGVGTDRTMTTSEYHNWKIIRQGNTFKWYCDDVQFNSNITLTWFDTYNPYTLEWVYWRRGTANVKDILIKPL